MLTLTGVLVALVSALLLLVQLPGVQTALTRAAASELSTRLDADVSVKSLKIRPFNALSLRGLVIIDRHPAVHPGTSACDTVLAVENVNASFSLRNLLSHNKIYIRSLNIRNAVFCLVNESLPDGSGTSNISRIFSSGREKDRDQNEGEKDFGIEISSLKASGLRYVMKNHRNFKPSSTGAISWSDLDVSDICLEASDISTDLKSVSFNVSRLSFNEKSGYRADLGGKCRLADGKCVIENLAIKDLLSDIRMSEFIMDFGSVKSFSDFMNKVRLHAEILPSVVDIQSISYYAPTLKKNRMRTALEGTFDGIVADFDVDRLAFGLETSRMEGTLTGTYKGIPGLEDMRLDMRLSDFRFTADGLTDLVTGWAPAAKVSFGSFLPEGLLFLNGHASGYLNSLSADLNMVTPDGRLIADARSDNLVRAGRPIEISGRVGTERLDIGKMLGKEQLGPCSAVAAVKAVIGGKGGLSITSDSLKVSSMEALGHVFSGIRAEGQYDGKHFGGRISSEDPALKGTVNASSAESGGIRSIRADADIRYADLAGLGLLKSDGKAIMSASLAGDFSLRDGGLDGSARIMGLKLEDGRGVHDAADVIISADTPEGLQRLRFSSSFADISYSGSSMPDIFISDLKAVSAGKYLPSLIPQPGTQFSGNRYDIAACLKGNSEIFRFFVPGAYAADSTSLRLGISSDGILSGNLKSKRIALKDKYLKGVDATFGNSGGKLSATVGTSEIHLSPFLLRTGRLAFIARDNTASVSFSYDNKTAADNRGDLSLSASPSVNPDGSLSMSGHILPSEIFINSAKWSVSPATFFIDKDAFGTEGLVLKCAGQKISVSGSASPSSAGQLNADISNLDISALTPFVPGFAPSGLVSGRMNLTSPLSGHIDLQAGLNCTALALGGERIGDLRIGCASNGNTKGYDIALSNVHAGAETLGGSGFFIPDGGRIGAELQLNSFGIACLAPVLESVFSSVSGSVSGDISISGTTREPSVRTAGLTLNETVARVAFTNVPYLLSGSIGVDDNGVNLSGITLSDRNSHSGRLTGGIKWNRLKDISFNTGIIFNDMEVVNMPYSAGSPFYGNASATGSLSLSGPLHALAMDIEATTGSGAVHIPVSGSAATSSSGLLTFTEPQAPRENDPYEDMMQKIADTEKVPNDMSIKVAANITPATEAFVELGSGGNTLGGRGHGHIDIGVKPSSKQFTINGNYEMSSGKVHVNALGLASRDFEVGSGSNIRFNGDIMDSDLDISAVYRTKAHIGTLISDTTATSRRTVNCNIRLEDKLMSPRVSLGIDIPDLDPLTKGRVEDALSTEDKVQKQFFSLLVSNGFLPDEQTGIVNNDRMIGGTLAEIMAGQLNSLLQRLDIPLDFGLDYQTGRDGANLYDVALSTAMFDNMVTVSGTVGNRENMSVVATSATRIAGDLDIGIKLDRSGAFLLNLFSHSADQYTNYLDNSQRNGVGVTYQKEYDTIKGLIHSIFHKKSTSQPDAGRQRRNTQGRKTVNLE